MHSTPLPALRATLGEEGSLKQVLRDLKENEGKGLEQAIRDTSDDEIVMHEDNERADEKVAVSDDLPTLFECHVFATADEIIPNGTKALVPETVL